MIQFSPDGRILTKPMPLLAAANLVNKVGGEALIPVKPQRILRENVVAKADEQTDISAQPRGANRLIAALATRTHIEGIASQALAEHRHAGNANCQTGVVAADDEDFGLRHLASLEKRRL